MFIWPLFLLILGWFSSLYAIKRVVKLKKMGVFGFDSLNKNNVKWFVLLVTVTLILMTIITTYFLLLGFNEYDLSSNELIFFKLTGVIMLIFSATSIVNKCSESKDSEHVNG